MLLTFFFGIVDPGPWTQDPESCVPPSASCVLGPASILGHAGLGCQLPLAQCLSYTAFGKASSIKPSPSIVYFHVAVGWIDNNNPKG